MVMWVLGEIMLFFFLYIYTKNMVRRRKGIAKNFPKDIPEQEVTVVLTIIVGLIISILTFGISVCAVLIFKMLS